MKKVTQNGYTTGGRNPAINTMLPLSKTSSLWQVAPGDGATDPGTQLSIVSREHTTTDKQLRLDSLHATF